MHVAYFFFLLYIGPVRVAEKVNVKGNEKEIKKEKNNQNINTKTINLTVLLFSFSVMCVSSLLIFKYRLYRENEFLFYP